MKILMVKKFYFLIKNKYDFESSKENGFVYRIKDGGNVGIYMLKIKQ